MGAWGGGWDGRGERGGGAVRGEAGLLTLPCHCLPCLAPPCPPPQIVYLIIIADVLVGVPPDFNGLVTNLVGVHDPSGALGGSGGWWLWVAVGGGCGWHGRMVGGVGLGLEGRRWECLMMRCSVECGGGQLPAPPPPPPPLYTFPPTAAAAACRPLPTAAHRPLLQCGT